MHNGKQEEKYLIFFIILYLIVDTLYTETKNNVKSCSRLKEKRFKPTHTQTLTKRDGRRKGIHLQFTVYECAEGVPETADESIHLKICTILYIAYQFKQKSFA